jgi:hypothetical protein
MMGVSTRRAADAAGGKLDQRRQRDQVGRLAHDGPPEVKAGRHRQQRDRAHAQLDQRQRQRAGAPRNHGAEEASGHGHQEPLRHRQRVEHAEPRANEPGPEQHPRQHRQPGHERAEREKEAKWLTAKRRHRRSLGSAGNDPGDSPEIAKKVRAAASTCKCDR